MMAQFFPAGVALILAGGVSQPASLLGQSPDIQPVLENEPLCYVMTAEGNVLNLEALCGGTTPRPRSPLGPMTTGANGLTFVRTNVGNVPVPRLNLRINRDTER